jgi:SET and MYND domain-containing protein 4
MFFFSFNCRSAALFHLKKYSDCLRDIELAFESKYPEEMHHKLFERQGASLREMGRIDDAIESFQKAINSLTLAHLTPKAEISRNQALTKLLESCKKLERLQAPPTSDESNQAPAVTGEKNSVYPHASYAVKVQYNNVVGRHTVAARDVKVGDVLISESPYSAIMLPGSYATQHCYHCFAATRAPVPCIQCASIIFCSRECRNSAWQTYHWAECSYGELVSPAMCARIGHLAMRLVMTKGLEQLLAYLKANPTETPVSDKSGLNSEGIYSSDYDCVYNLVANSSHRKPEEFFDYTVAACVLMKIMQVTGYLRPIADSPADIELVGGAVLRHLQIVQCNAKRIVELSWPEKFDDPKPVFIGVGLYPTAALVNHSCDPNADLNFYGNSVVVRAIRNIYEGEEICISYGPVFYEVKQRIRTAQLKGAFYFSCRYAHVRLCYCCFMFHKKIISHLGKSEFDVFLCGWRHVYLFTRV